MPEDGEAAGERGDEVVLRARERLDATLVRDVGSEPARAPLALAERLLEVAVEPLAGERPGADERLPDEVRVVRVDATLHRERIDERAPFVRNPAQRDQPRTYVA